MSEPFVITSANVLTKANNIGATEYVIPSNVKSIVDAGSESESAFYDLKSSVFSVSFASGSLITRIGAYAFNKCTNMQSIDFSNANSLLTIGGYAFYRCNSLTSIVFPSSLETIEYYGAFKCYFS